MPFITFTTGSVKTTCGSTSTATPYAPGFGTSLRVIQSGAALGMPLVFVPPPATTRNVCSASTGAPPSGLSAVALTVYVPAWRGW
jgi:hypothetical protein